MTSGIITYELRSGTQAIRNHTVNIFEYDDLDIVNIPQLLDEFHYRCAQS